jgi:hypothetical protein
MIRLWLLLLVAGTASAAELRSIEVEHNDGEYSLVSVAWFDAGLDETFEVFRTWDYSEQFSSAIVEARDLPPDERGRPGFYSRAEGCILFFCKTLVRQGWVEYERNRELRAYAEPEHSDFEFSNETWTFREENGGTRVVYKLHMDPKFWVPPAIGPYLLKRKLRSSGGDALDRIERVAQRLAESGEFSSD